MISLSVYHDSQGSEIHVGCDEIYPEILIPEGTMKNPIKSVKPMVFLWFSYGFPMVFLTPPLKPLGPWMTLGLPPCHGCLEIGTPTRGRLGLLLAASPELKAKKNHGK